jgi:hypothetical protein
MKRVLAGLLAFAFTVSACAAGFDFRTTGTTTTEIFNFKPSAAVPPVSAVGWGKLFVPASGVPGYTAGNFYISQNGSAWQLLSAFAGAGTVTSVFGRTGAIVGNTGDYICAQVTSCTDRTTTNTFTVSSGTPLLIKPSSGPTANTKQIDVQATGAGTTLFSVDSEGDTTTHDLSVTGAFTTAALKASGTAGAGYAELPAQSSNPATPASGFRIFADSTGRLTWKGTNGFIRTFDGTANTADRVYTLPDAGGTMTVLGNASTGSGSVVLASSPTITTPTIASFTNATHNHQSAAGGGTLDTAAIASGTLGVTRGGTGTTTSTGSGSVVLSASPALTGTPTAPTATGGTNTTQLATTAFVQTAVLAGGGTKYQTVQEEGSGLTQRPTLNFVGSAITAADNAGATRTDVTLSQSPAGATSVVGTTRTVSTSTPLSGGGDLSADLTLSCPTCVTTSRTISTTAPLTGGGDLSANRTLALTITPGGATTAVGSTRTISTTSPLGGGGDLSADLTLTCTTCAVKNANNLFSVGQSVTNSTNGGSALTVSNSSISNVDPAISATTNGSGYALSATSGAGSAAFISSTGNGGVSLTVANSNALNTGSDTVDVTHKGSGGSYGIYVTATNANGYAIRGESSGTASLAGGIGGFLTSSSSNASSRAVEGINSGAGYGGFFKSNTGPTAFFRSSSNLNTSPTLVIQDAYVSGSSQAANTLMLAVKGTSAADNAGSVVASIDKEGDAVVNGLTASAGATITTASSGSGPVVRIDDTVAHAGGTLQEWYSNGVQIATIDKTGLKIIDPSAAADTKLLDVQASGGISLASIDNEGDLQARLIYATGDVDLSQTLTVENNSDFQTATFHDSVQTNDVTISGGLSLLTDSLSVFSGNIAYTPHVVTFSATPTFDWQHGVYQRITLTGNVTSLTLASGSDGGHYIFEIIQDGTGSRTVSWPASVKWPSGAPALGDANDRNIVECWYDGTYYLCKATNYPL